MNNKDKDWKAVRKVRCFLTDTADQHIARFLPSEFNAHIFPILKQMKNVCDEYLESRGRFKNDK